MPNFKIKKVHLSFREYFTHDGEKPFFESYEVDRSEVAYN